MGEHGFVGFTLFMLLAWFAWNTGSRIRRQAGRNAETRWAADLASMVQVGLIGYASSGAFLGLAYFDYYYTLISIIVVCNVILQKQIDSLQSVSDKTVRGATVVAGQASSEFRSLNGKSQ